MPRHPTEPRPRQAPRPPGRPWAVTANALLLVLEAGGLIGAAALYLGPLGTLWPVYDRFLTPEHMALITGLIFAVLATLALIAAVGLFRLLPGAWTVAVLVQGGDLLLALGIYVGRRPAYVYLMMVYGLLMVLYLHQADVQTAFREPRPQAPLHPPAVSSDSLPRQP